MTSSPLAVVMAESNPFKSFFLHVRINDCALQIRRKHNFIQKAGLSERRDLGDLKQQETVECGESSGRIQIVFFVPAPLLDCR